MPFSAYKLPQFQAVVIRDGEESVVIGKTDKGWELSAGTLHGKLIRTPNSLLPIFLRKGDQLESMIDIYDRNFKILKSLPVRARFEHEIFVRDKYLFYTNYYGSMERIDISTQQVLPPLGLPEGYSVVANRERLVVKRWNSDDNAYV